MLVDSGSILFLSTVIFLSCSSLGVAESIALRIGFVSTIELGGADSGLLIIGSASVEHGIGSDETAFVFSVCGSRVGLHSGTSFSVIFTPVLGLGSIGRPVIMRIISGFFASCWRPVFVARV